MFGADDSIGKKKKMEEADLDITPMIDVTFLLLIFFMVTSTMQATPDRDIPPSNNGTKVDKSKSTIITISAAKTQGSEPTILIDKRQATLEDVKAYVMDGMQAGRENVIIMADRHVPEGAVMEVEKAVAEVEGVSLHVGVRDKNG